MAQHVKKLSLVLENTLTSPGYYGAGGGLWLRISKSGSKNWVFRFTYAGRSRKMGLGALHTISLAMAREKALQCRRMLDDKQDPIVARDAARTKEKLSLARVKTFEQCAAAYIRRTAAAGRAPSMRRKERQGARAIIWSPKHRSGHAEGFRGRSEMGLESMRRSSIL